MPSTAQPRNPSRQFKWRGEDREYVVRLEVHHKFSETERSLFFAAFEFLSGRIRDHYSDEKEPSMLAVKIARGAENAFIDHNGNKEDDVRKAFADSNTNAAKFKAISWAFDSFEMAIRRHHDMENGGRAIFINYLNSSKRVKTKKGTRGPPVALSNIRTGKRITKISETVPLRFQVNSYYTAKLKNEKKHKRRYAGIFMHEMMHGLGFRDGKAGRSFVQAIQKAVAGTATTSR